MIHPLGFISKVVSIQKLKSLYMCQCIPTQLLQRWCTPSYDLQGSFLYNKGRFTIARAEYLHSIMSGYVLKDWWRILLIVPLNNIGSICVFLNSHHKYFNICTDKLISLQDPTLVHSKPLFQHQRYYLNHTLSANANMMSWEMGSYANNVLQRKSKATRICNCSQW